MSFIKVWQMHVEPTTPKGVVDWIGSGGKSKRLMLNHNLHSVYLYTTDSEFRKAYSLAEKVIIDGFPVLAVLNIERMLSGTKPVARDTRCGSTDWVFALHDLPHGSRIALLGAQQESVTSAVSALCENYPSFEIRGWNGYDEVTRLEVSQFSDLIDFAPDLVLVGLGMPMQELFIMRNWNELPAATYASVGGAIDQISGHQKLAPRWTGRYGLEWLWRLASDPARLYKRYLIEPFKLIISTIRYRRQLSEDWNGISK